MPEPVTLTRLDARYPSRLVSQPDAPPCITWQGGPLEAERAVAIVGSRLAGPAASAFAAEIAGVLARANVVVVSGGALGIDAAAHTGALAAGGRTWVVAGTSPGHCFPPEHADLFETVAQGPGAMLWPFAPGDRGAFLARNRVLVALADAVVVVQAAALRSGALHAAQCARRLGKPLWVVPAAPWMPEFAGSLKLLDDGARALTSSVALLRSLGLSPPADLVPAPELGPIALLDDSISSEYAILRFVSEVPLHLDAIVARADQSTQAVAAALLTLALENVVVEGPPGFFRRR